MATVVASVLVLGGCYDQVLDPDIESNGRLTVNNDEDALAQRVAYPDEPVPIESSASPVGPAGAPAMALPASVTLTLIAEVSPPSVNGTTVQATSIWAADADSVIVSYNTKGAVARGALDYWTKLDNKKPVLRSSVEFLDSDVNAVAVQDGRAFAALSTSDLAFPTPSAIESIEIQVNHKFRLGGSQRTALASFAATSVVGTGSLVYATSGNGGSVYALDKNDITNQLGAYALDDARWVAYDQTNNRVAVLQGTPGRISLFQQGSFPGGSMVPLNTYPFSGADVAEAKNTVEVVNGRAFIAAGPAGVQVMCLSTGQIVASVPRPDPASVGLSPSVVQTNSVTVYKNLMFISNGEAGVYAAAAPDDFDQGSCTDPLAITVLGRLQFDNFQSANHVLYRDDMLFVAAGLGGVKVVDVQVN